MLKLDSARHAIKLQPWLFHQGVYFGFLLSIRHCSILIAADVTFDCNVIYPANSLCLLHPFPNPLPAFLTIQEQVTESRFRSNLCFLFSSVRVSPPPCRALHRTRRWKCKPRSSALISPPASRIPTVESDVIRHYDEHEDWYLPQH